MIEIIDNSVQLAVLAVMAVLCAVYSYRTNQQNAGILAMFYGSFVLGDLYWLLYLVFYGYTPRVFYISAVSWYAAYVFLDLVLLRMASEEERGTRWPALWLVPVFPAAMCLYYLQYGDVFGNIVSATLMGLLMFHAVRGLVWARKHGGNRGRRMFCACVLVFCLLEYGEWTASCFFDVDTLASPYYWFDFALTALTILFLPAYRKAVEA